MQVLGQLLRRAVAARGLLLDRLQADRLQVARDLRARAWRGRGGSRSVDLLDQPVAVGRRERRPERQQLVERQAQRVDVAAGVGLAVEPLRGHVPQRADDVAGVGQVVVGDRLGQAEVGDPDGPVEVEQQVRGLDVAVEDPLRVGVGQCAATWTPIRATSRQ